LIIFGSKLWMRNFLLCIIDTWDLVPLPPSKSVVGCCLVYKIKTNSDESIERYKVRLVVQWYSQQYGMDYKKTSAPVTKMTTIRSLIIVASIRQWYISQLDVKNVLLNRDLQEKFYITPPLGVSHDPEYVCKLKKMLYGLKQAYRASFEKFSVFLLWSRLLDISLVVMILLFLLSVPMHVVSFCP
jgi:hypothetical protein